MMQPSDRSLTKAMALVASTAALLVERGCPADTAIVLAVVEQSKGNKEVFTALRNVFEEIGEDTAAVNSGNAEFVSAGPQ